MLNKENSYSNQSAKNEGVPQKFTQSRVKNLYDFFLRRICQFIKQNHSPFSKQLENLLNVKKKKLGHQDFIQLFHNRKISQEQQIILQEKGIEYLQTQAIKDIQKSKQQQKTKDYSLQCIDQLIELIKDPNAFKYMKIQKNPSQQISLSQKEGMCQNSNPQEQMKQTFTSSDIQQVKTEQQPLLENYFYQQQIQSVPVPMIGYFSFQPQFERYYNTIKNDLYIYQNYCNMQETQNSHYHQQLPFSFYQIPQQQLIYQSHYLSEAQKYDETQQKHLRK